MGLRGPKPGWTRAAEKQPSADEAHAAMLVEYRALPPHYREHPDKLEGAMLKHLAFLQGVAKSSLARMTDEQIRREVKSIQARRQEDEAA